jgi:flagellar basal body-associated protein FliL
VGLFTWIIVAVVILAIIGLGWQNFFSGVTQGAEKVASNPMIKNATDEAGEFVANTTENAAKEVIERII